MTITLASLDSSIFRNLQRSSIWLNWHHETASHPSEIRSGQKEKSCIAALTQEVTPAKGHSWVFQLQFFLFSFNIGLHKHNNSITHERSLRIQTSELIHIHFTYCATRFEQAVWQNNDNTFAHTLHNSYFIHGSLGQVILIDQLWGLIKEPHGCR